MSQDSDNVKLGFNPNNKRCVHVDTGIRLFNDGTTMFCCQSNEQLTTKDGTIGNIQKHTIQEIREGKKAKEIKQALEDGFEHPNCSKCWNEEASGMKSKRLRDNQENPDLINSVELKNMEINLGNICNMRCRTCGPWSSSLWGQEYYQQMHTFRGPRDELIPTMEKKVYNKWLGQFSKSYNDESKVWEELDKYWSELKNIDIYGGEPFLVDKQWQALKKNVDSGVSKKQNLHFNTNGTVYDPSKIEIMKGFKTCKISFSIDGKEEQYEYIRNPGKWEQTKANLLQHVKIANQTPGWSVIVCITISFLNVYYLPELLEEFMDMNVYAYVNFVHEPAFYKIQNLRPDLKLAVKEKYHNSKIWNPTFDDKKTHATKYANGVTSYETSKAQLEQVINFMEIKKWNPSSFKEFVYMIAKGDEYRKESFKDTFPEWWDLIYNDPYTEDLDDKFRTYRSHDTDHPVQTKNMDIENLYNKIENKLYNNYRPGDPTAAPDYFTIKRDKHKWFANSERLLNGDEEV